MQPRLSIRDFVAATAFEKFKVKVARQSPKANDPGLEATDAVVCTYYVLPGLSPMVQSPD